MGAEPAGERGAFRVLVLDPDADRGRRTVAAIEACGFRVLGADRLASALDHASTERISVVVVERGAARSSQAPGMEATTSLDAGQITRLRSACGATLVLEWSGEGAEAGPADPTPPWADARIHDLDALVGRIARHAAAAGAVAEGELERMRQAVDEARAAAHDMSQPLTTILARTQLLLAKMPEADPNYRALSIILQEAERLATTVQRFQAFLPFLRQS